MAWNQPPESGGVGLAETVVIKSEHKHIGTICPPLIGPDGDFDRRSKFSNTSGAADEAEVYHPQNRMLQDSTGRLCKFTTQLPPAKDYDIELSTLYFI